MLRRRRSVGTVRHGPSRPRTTARGIDRLRIAAGGRLPRHAGRIALAVLLFVLLTVEVSIQVVHSEGSADRMAATTWSTAVEPIISESNSVGAAVARLRADATGLSRLNLDQDLGTAIAEAHAGESQLSGLGLSPPSQNAAMLLATVLTERAEACMLLTGGLDEAIGPGSPSAASNELAQAGAEMERSDATYLRFVAAVPKADGRSLLAASQWVADAGVWSTSSLTSWVAALHGTPALASRSALSLVAVSIEPPLVHVTGLPTTTTTSTTTSTTSTTTSSTTTTIVSGSTSSTTTTVTLPPPSTTTTTTVPPTTTTLQTLPPGAVSVLPPTTSIVVVVVVANAGDVTEQDVVVTAKLVLVHRSAKTTAPLPPPVAVEATAGSLAPGGSRYLVLPTLQVTAADSYVLTVDAAGTGPTGPAGSPSDTYDIYIA